MDYGWVEGSLVRKWQSTGLVWLGAGLGPSGKPRSTLRWTPFQGAGKSSREGSKSLSPGSRNWGRCCKTGNPFCLPERCHDYLDHAVAPVKTQGSLWLTEKLIVWGGGKVNCCYCSVAKLCLTLKPHRLQHARLPCPLASPALYSNSCPLSRRHCPTVSSSVVPFSSRPPSFPASGSFPTSQLFTSGGQRAGASASVFPMNIQGWFSLGWIGLVSLQSEGLSRVFFSTQFESINS